MSTLRFSSWTIALIVVVVATTRSTWATGPVPLEREQARAAATRFLEGNDDAADVLVAAGPNVVPLIQDVFVSQDKLLRWGELLERVAQASLQNTIDTQPNLIYYGQFSHLVVLGEHAGMPLLRIFRSEDNARELRVRAGIAMGDLRGQFSEQTILRMRGELRNIIHDFLTEVWCVTEAGYVLARLGDRSHVEKRMRADLEVIAQPPTAGNLTDLIASHTQLAEIHYRTEDYPQAVKHYRQKRAILGDLRALVRPELRGGIDQEIALLDYNMACSLSLAGRIDECFATLEGALDGDLVSTEMIQADGDLRALRAHANYASWLAEQLKREKSLKESGANTTPNASPAEPKSQP